MDNHLLAHFTQDNTSSTPGEIIHFPERVERQQEREDRDGQDVEHHPSNHVPLAAQHEHQRLQTVHSGNKNDRQSRDLRVNAGGEIDQVDNL